jgi:adenosine deaminase
VVTVNSDAPAYFGGYVNESYGAIRQALGLTRERLVTLARNSFEGSFLDATEKGALIDPVERYASTLPRPRA